MGTCLSVDTPFFICIVILMGTCLSAVCHLTLVLFSWSSDFSWVAWFSLFTATKHNISTIYACFHSFIVVHICPCHWPYVMDEWYSQIIVLRSVSQKHDRSTEFVVLIHFKFCVLDRLTSMSLISHSQLNQMTHVNLSCLGQFLHNYHLRPTIFSVIFMLNRTCQSVMW